MKVTVELQQNVNFKGTSGTGHDIMMDGPEDHGGENLGARPMEPCLLGWAVVRLLMSFIFFARNEKMLFHVWRK